MHMISRTCVFVEVVMACSVGITTHWISRAVSGMVGPKVFKARLLRGTGGRRLRMLPWRMESVIGGTKRAVVFTPGKGMNKCKENE